MSDIMAGAPSAQPDPHALSYVAALGSALVSTTTPTPQIEQALDQVAAVEHLPVQTSITPAGVFVVEQDSGRTSLHRPGSGDLRFDQTERLYELVNASTEGTVRPDAGLAQLTAIHTTHPVVSEPFRVIGFWCCAFGLALRQNPGRNELLAVALIGIVMAVILVLMPRAGRLESMMVVGAAFVAGTLVTMLVDHGQIRFPNQVVVPLMASFIPGAALTVGAFEVSVGALQSGVLRLCGAMYRLVLLGLGLLPAMAALDPPFELGADFRPLTAVYWQPLGVALFGVGIWLAFSAPRGALPALITVLLTGWAVQSLTHVETHVYLSSFLAAIAAVLVARVLYRHLGGPPEVLMLTPLFRTLAPGGLVLIGMTGLVADGTTDLDPVRLVLTLIAVTIGMGCGLLVSDSFKRATRWW